MTASPACLSRQVGDFLPPAGGVPGWLPALTLPPLYPAGDVPALPPVAPCLWLAFLPPIPPPPFPGGEGGDQGYFMQGAPPLASLGLNPSGAGSRGEPLARRGACPVGCLPDSAAAVPSGGLARFVACYPLPLACFPAPYPPAPLPRRGRGSPKVYFAGGFAPRHPCTEPLAALTEPSIQVPSAREPAVWCKTDRKAFP